MDPYQNVMRKRQRRQKNFRRLGTFLLFILLLVSICWTVYKYGGYCVTLHMNGEQEVVLKYGESFEDPRGFASFQGNYLITYPMTVPVNVSGEVDPTRTGTYELTYSARFLFWSAKQTRTVRIVDRTKPKILLNSNPGAYCLPGDGYVEEGFIARDNYDGDLTDQVQIRKYHNRIVYTVTDSSGNTAEAVRKIVCYDPVFPEISLEGEQEIQLALGEKYVEPGYRATDNLEGDITHRVKVTGKVDSYHAGTYTLCYEVKDKYGNRTTATRRVKVVSTVQPEIVVPEGKVIYLTFDDGPGPYTRQLLDVLKKYDVKATFFVVSSRYMHLLKDMVDEGHSVGIHSVSHDYDEIYASEDAYVADLLKMQSIIEDYCGVRTTLLRFPGGSSNTVSKFNSGIMSRLTQLVDRMGFQYFDWNVNSGDAGQTKQRDEVVQYVIEGVQEYDVSVVLQHDIKKYSVEAVEKIICWGLENGYRFLPLEPNSPNAHHKVRN